MQPVADDSKAEPDPNEPPADGDRIRFREHVGARRERALLAMAGFVAAIALSRLATGVLHAKGAGGAGGLTVAGVHIHHFVFGIAILLATSLSWLLLGGIDDEQPRWFRITAIAFGVGTGLLLDEFALWLNLEDVYWQQQGRQSIEAACAFVALLALGLMVRPYGSAVWRKRRR